VISSRVVIVSLLVATATPTSAQPFEVRAQKLYDNGRNFMAAGKIAEACAAFEQSHRLDPAVTTLIALATCREKFGQLANARDLFLEAERQTQSANDNVSAQLHSIARDRAALLEPRVPRLTINIPDQCKIDGLEILRDTESIPATAWNRALPINGGTYKITARAPGLKEWSASVTLASEADAQTVDIPDLRKLKSGPGKSPEAPVPNALVMGLPATTPASRVSGSAQPSKQLEASDTARPRHYLVPIAVGAASVLLLGGALGFSLWGDSTYSTAKGEMTDQAKRDSLYESANHKRYTAGGLAAVGAGCAGVAVWLYLRQRGARGEPTSRAGLILAPTASGIGVVGQF
jgi:hypothetical protein